MRLSVVGAIVSSLVACGGEREPSVVLGLATDLAVGFELERVEVTTTIDGVQSAFTTLSFREGKLHLPAIFIGKTLTEGSTAAFDVAGFELNALSPSIVRSASTRVAAGRRVLLPLALDAACLGVPCDEATTCIEGVCSPRNVAPDALAEFDPYWLVSAKDACKPEHAPPPELELGQGRTSFATLTDNEIVSIEPGAQGGHHVWLALRVAGLRQLGSRVIMSGRFPDLASEVPPFEVGLTLRRGPEQRCEVYGLRFQIDRSRPVSELRGRALELNVTLSDPEGYAATAMKRVVIEAE